MAMLWDAQQERFIGTIANTDFLAAILISHQRLKEKLLESPSPKMVRKKTTVIDFRGFHPATFLHPFKDEKENQKRDYIAHSTIIDDYLANYRLRDWLG